MTATAWTCWECFGTVVDDDNDGIGYCRDCHTIVGADGRAIGRVHAWPWPTQIYEGACAASEQLLAEQVRQTLLEPDKCGATLWSNGAVFTWQAR